MKQILNYIKGILSDHNGNPSSKRWIAIIAFILIGISWGADLFYQLVSTEFIFNALMFLVVGCLGISGVEKFAPGSGPNEPSV